MIRDPPLGFIGNVVYETMVRLGVASPEMKWGETWESIILPDGYTKPTKEVFEAKFQEIIREYSFKELRQERNRRLAEVDWVFSTDYQMEDGERSVWVAYRQALRDLPSVTEDPTNPVWPTKPSTPKGTTLDVNLKSIKDRELSEKSQITLLQNVVYSLTKRIEALENA
jgi:hypothetical protein